MLKRIRVLMLMVVLFGLAAAAAGPKSKEARAAEEQAAWDRVVDEAKTAAGKYDVRILRDTWGVPHIFGKTDADAAFGLAYAHSEDDFATIEDTLITTRAMGASVNGLEAAPIDFIIHLLGVWDDVNEKYERDLRPETRAICEAYAAGVNYYSTLHADKVRAPSLLPFTGKDIVAGFVFRSPFFYGLDGAVMELFGPERKRDVSIKSIKKAALSNFSALDSMASARDFLTSGLPTGSNTFSIGPSRSADGKTYLNINSHQPWSGPVAWYEAHMHSEEGWDAVGGTFPGTPVILHGHNRHLGWAHTVNSPDLVDIYVLDINPDNANQYRYDGEWRDFEVSEVAIKVRINKDSPMTMTVRREVLRSVYGPAVRQDHGVYAIRYAGMGEIRHVEQWYRMNKSTNMDEWLDAMKMRAIPSLNCGYADKEGNILYLYNALLPIREEGYDWEQYLPGDTSATLWTEYLPFEDLPMVKNPPSGFVQNCNSSPFKTTVGEGNPNPEDYSKTFGIETTMTNRALRAIELFGADESITEEEFYAYKYDMKYSTASFLGKAIKTILDLPPSDDALVQEAIGVLREWDLECDPDSTGAALAVMMVLPLYRSSEGAPEPAVLLESLRDAARNLKDVHGRIDVPWKDVNRLHRGSLDVGLGGGPDTLHAIYGAPTEDKAHFVGRAGDCYVLLVNWDRNGKVSSRSIHQYGSATLDESSPHYADQVPLFINRKTKPVWFDEADIRANLEREYRPGEEAR